MVSHGADHVHVPDAIFSLCVFSDLGWNDPSLVVGGLINDSIDCCC